MNDALTAHARARLQQRGIRADLLEHLLAYGSERHDHRGGVIVHMDKAARRRVAAAGDAAAQAALARLRRTYAVVSGDGALLTVGHRYRRLPSH